MAITGKPVLFLIPRNAPQRLRSIYQETFDFPARQIIWNLPRQTFLRLALYSFLVSFFQAHIAVGLYTLIVATTLWTTFSSPKKSGNAFFLTVIIILYVLTTVAFGFGWAYERRAFIQNGDNFVNVFSALQAISPWWRAFQLVDGISGGMSTFIVDVTIIWRCWVLWGRRWRIILIPALCAIAGTIAKSLQIRSIFINTTRDIGNTGGFAADTDWALIYISLTLATTLLCTLLVGSYSPSVTVM
ncbi:hypothetical protein ARMSODRAFT_1025050 [Armillaria solidipes]|uniref:Uncharacterized protein n=1 Tax=Armillaria solidipes TaxID=1076256 RepID=A0A2H3BC05_9AGAR|nr:hypothetical protein ARMSODRAFT_1025050 [Armillaria solidipes]